LHKRGTTKTNQSLTRKTRKKHSWIEERKSEERETGRGEEIRRGRRQGRAEEREKREKVICRHQSDLLRQ